MDGGHPQAGCLAQLPSSHCSGLCVLGLLGRLDLATAVIPDSLPHLPPAEAGAFLMLEERSGLSFESACQQKELQPYSKRSW